MLSSAGWPFLPLHQNCRGRLRVNLPRLKKKKSPATTLRPTAILPPPAAADFPHPHRRTGHLPRETDLSSLRFPAHSQTSPAGRPISLTGKRTMRECRRSMRRTPGNLFLKILPARMQGMFLLPPIRTREVILPPIRTRELLLCLIPPGFRTVFSSTALRE